MQRRQFAAQAAAVITATAFAPMAFAQERTVRILIGFPPGGSADVVARILADKMRVSLGQNVIVDNKPGAAGRLALAELKRSPPDGSVLIFSPSGAMVIHPWLYANLGYDTVKDFTPISLGSTFDFAVTAGPGAPAGDLKAVLAWMKANPGKANYATSGAGTVPHFAGQLLAQASGVPMTHVAYRGGAPAAQDLIGGQVPLMVDTASETIEHHRAGKVRILAVTGEAQPRAARRADAERSGHQCDGRCLLRAVRPAGHVARAGRAHRQGRGRRASPARCAGKDLRAGPRAGACGAGGTGDDPGDAPEAVGTADQELRLQG